MPLEILLSFQNGAKNLKTRFCRHCSAKARYNKKQKGEKNYG
jgi:hypothetical protein